MAPDPERPPPGPPTGGMSRGDWYESVFERRAAAGEDIHGEARFVLSWNPDSVLDAGCGTGRVARELSRHGVQVVGFDVDPEMLDTARRKAPHIRWVRHDVTLIDLPQRFGVVLLAGNLVNFVLPERRPLAIANMARHLAPGGLLISGHSLKAGEVPFADLDGWAARSGLELAERWSTWQRAAFRPGGDYSVSVHRVASSGASPEPWTGRPRHRRDRPR